MSAPAGLPAQLRVFERGWLSSNNVLFVGREEPAFVDTGYATHAEQTLAPVAGALKERPWTGCSIRTCTATIAAGTRRCSVIRRCGHSSRRRGVRRAALG